MLSALVYMRALQDGFGEGAEAVAQCLRAHLERGLGYLASERGIGSISAFVNRWIDNKRTDAEAGGSPP